MLDSFMRHVTKDSYGPVSFSEQTDRPAVVHKFNDSFSVLNWGKMPDTLIGRGKVSALVFSVLNQEFKSSESWKLYLRSPEALSFRKAGASISNGGNLSTMLNELAEKLPVRSNYLGVVDESRFRNLDQRETLKSDVLIPGRIQPLTEESIPHLYPVCEFYPEAKIPHSTVMGRTVWDFSVWRNLQGPKMLPFEFQCHFTLQEESIKSLKVDAVSIPKTASIHTLQAGTQWDFPLIELLLPQDPHQRRLGLGEALAISGFTADQLQGAMLTAAWIAAWTRFQLRSFHLKSVRLRMALDERGNLVLIDGFSLDDLQVERAGLMYHPENLLDFYQKTSWCENVLHAQKHSLAVGLSEWKRLCVEPAPWLDTKIKSRFEEGYQEIASIFSGRA